MSEAATRVLIFLIVVLIVAASIYVSSLPPVREGSVLNEVMDSNGRRWTLYRVKQKDGTEEIYAVEKEP